MKKIKLLAPIATIAAIAPVATMVACSCSNKEIPMGQQGSTNYGVGGKFNSGTTYDFIGSLSNWNDGKPSGDDLKDEVIIVISSNTTTQTDFINTSKIDVKVNGNSASKSIAYRAAKGSVPAGYAIKINSTLSPTASITIKNVKVTSTFDGKILFYPEKTE